RKTSLQPSVVKLPPEVPTRKTSEPVQPKGIVGPVQISPTLSELSPIGALSMIDTDPGMQPGALVSRDLTRSNRQIDVNADSLTRPRVDVSVGPHVTDRFTQHRKFDGVESKSLPINGDFSAMTDNEPDQDAISLLGVAV